ncbi:hypothetical protein, partial [Pseudomonas kitaguniensis]|uniref:hypothetical protein n=1 Tax=Pseudomonas kitaguniensis TaxID=2607908 RepID=UPI003BA3D2FF
VNCGRGLAPDGGGSVNSCINCKTAIGSKPSPTKCKSKTAVYAKPHLIRFKHSKSKAGGLKADPIFQAECSQLWEGLAPDGGGSVNSCINCKTAIGSKPPPTKCKSKTAVYAKPHLIRFNHSKSKAGGLKADPIFQAECSQLWEGACSRWRWVSQFMYQL